MSEDNKPKAKPAVKKTTGHTVSKGKALTCKSRIISGGEKIRAEDLSGGEDALTRLVKCGYVVKH